MQTNPRATYTVDAYLYRGGYSCVEISVQFYRISCTFRISVRAQQFFPHIQHIFKTVNARRSPYSLFWNVKCFHFIAFPSIRSWSLQDILRISICFHAINLHIFLHDFRVILAEMIISRNFYSPDLLLRDCVYLGASRMCFAVRDCFYFLFRQSRLARTPSSCIL